MKIEQAITPFLWFDNNAEEAASFYTTIFKNSSIDTISRYTKSGPRAEDSVMVVAFTLNGQQFTALNGGPTYKFTEAISLMVNCDSQEEVDYYWAKLTEGGKEVACGWLKDKFGLSWQIVPVRFMELINTNDDEKRDRVMKAMMQMVKLDIKVLEDAAKVK